MKAENKVKEIFVNAGYNYDGDNRKRTHRTIAKLIDSGIVSFEVCEPGKVWVAKDNFRYNIRIKIVGLPKFIFRYHIKGTIEAFDVLRSIGRVLQKPEVKEVVSSYVDIDSTCQRCGGAGYIPYFSFYCNGICFGCYGLGHNPKHHDHVEIKN